MADNRPSSSRGAALKVRLGRKQIIAAVLALLGLTVLVVLALSSRDRAESPEPETVSETPVPPTQAPPAPAVTPEAVDRVPADTSSSLFVHNVERRDGFPLLSWDVTAFQTNSRGRMSYSGNVRTLTGIDVSEHQYDIDWKKVAADGVDFAMIRVGYRGSTAGGLYLDEYFEKNITGAHNAGIPVGVYFYSQAVTPEEAREEAEFVLEHIRGRHVTFPVVFDWEIVGGSEARTYAVSRRELCECTRAFCDAVAEEGYEPMIYFTRYLAYRKYILRNLADYGFWYAEYEPQPRIAFDFDMWQYSETGSVAGIEGEVDLNLYFIR